MNKRNSLALFALLIVGLFSLFTPNIFSQMKEVANLGQSPIPCSGEKFVMPETISPNDEAFTNYLELASVPRDKRQVAFGKLTNEQKASFFSVHFALQFVKRLEMTKEQRDFILESISKISADLYDKDNPKRVAAASEVEQEMENRAFGLFIQKDARQILSGLFANKDEDIALLRKYEDLLTSGTQLRKKLVRQMSIGEKVAIWKTQLAFHLATSSLSKEQKDFIVEVIFKTQTVFESSSNLRKGGENKFLEGLESRALRLFTKAEAYAVFMTIGIQKQVRDFSPFATQTNFGKIRQETRPPSDC